MPSPRLSSLLGVATIGAAIAGSAGAAPVRVNREIYVQEISIRDSNGVPVGSVNPGQNYRARFLLKNNSPVGHRFLYVETRMTVMGGPNSGAQIFSDFDYVQQVPAFTNPEAFTLAPGKIWEVTIPVRFGSPGSTPSKPFLVTVTAGEIPVLSGSATVPPLN